VDVTTLPWLLLNFVDPTSTPFSRWVQRSPVSVLFNRAHVVSIVTAVRQASVYEARRSFPA
jgi:hypothetical protein